jgi:hypothetical protein
MKYVLAILLFLVPLCVIGQTPEYNFPSAYHGRMIKLSQAGYKYLIGDNVNKQLRLYNMDSTLYKTIDVPQYTGYTVTVYPLWVSDNLFNSDNLIEYTILYNGTVDKLEVINENGVVLNSVPGSAFSLIGMNNVGNYKLIVRSTDLNNVSVYSLPGVLPCMECEE